MNIVFIYLFHEDISTAIMCDEIQPQKKKKHRVLGMTSTSLYIV